ncbi:MarR family transcriptional regulator [Streptomyces sp. NPDC050743]|uniref:MarR family transcriptional regulator n=1 Tax=Streptomyces sp. NPDC050743 TaxID=3365634 RepID=UPI0037B5F983
MPEGLRLRSPRLGGLSLVQVSLLEPLAAEADVPVGRLASSADVSVPTATRVLRQLVTKGIVVRRRSAEDERRVLVSRTDDGAERLALLRSRLRERRPGATRRSPGRAGPVGHTPAPPHRTRRRFRRRFRVRLIRRRGRLRRPGTT